MKLEEMVKGDDLFLTVGDGEGRWTYKTKVKKVLEGKGLFLLEEEDGGVDLENKKVLFITKKTENGLLQWDNVKIGRYERSGKEYLFVMSEDDSEDINRRDAFRVDVGEDIRIVVGRLIYDGYLVDVSQTGLAVECKNKLPRVVELEIPWESRRVLIKAEVVRETSFDTFTRYGLMIIGEQPKEMVDYIMNKHRKSLRENAGYSF